MIMLRLLFAVIGVLVASCCCCSSLAAETWPAVRAAGSARTHDLLTQLLAIARGEVVPVPLGGVFVEPPFPEGWGMMRIFLNQDEFIRRMVPLLIDEMAAEGIILPWDVAQEEVERFVDNIVAEVIEDGIFAAADIPFFGEAFMLAEAVALTSWEVWKLFENNNARVETSCNPAIQGSGETPMLFFLGALEYDMDTGVNISTPGTPLYIPAPADTMSVHRVTHVLSKDGWFEWTCDGIKDGFGFGTGYANHFPDNTLVTFEITRHPCDWVPYSMFMISWECHFDIQVSHWAPFKPAPPTPAPTAPTPAPATPAPTTPAPTPDYSPDCLGTFPGAETKSPNVTFASELCREHVVWLRANWNLTGRPFPGEETPYEAAGVDGSDCTILNYLSTTRDDYWCNCPCPA